MLLDEQRSHGPALKKSFMYIAVVDMEYPVAWAIVSGPYPSRLRQGATAPLMP
jgi:hypothetical protein